jgi:DUF1680 family protein
MTRRDFVLALTTAVTAALAAARGDGAHAAITAAVQTMATDPGIRLRRLPLGAVRPRGWIQAQMLRDLDHGFAGRLDALSPHVANDLFAHRLQAADGQLAWWDAESRGNWLWGYTLLSHLADAPRHRERANALVNSLRSTQDSDGYLGIHAAAVRYRTGDVENGELWAQSRALLVLLAHHELTGDAASLAAARRAADLTLARYDGRRSPFGSSATTDDRTGVTHGLCYIDALQVLHEITGEERYAAAAARMLHAFDAWPSPFPNDDFAARNLADPLRALHGHAVHTVEHLRAVAFGSQDETRLRSALRKLRASSTPSGAVIGDEGLHGVPHPLSGYEYCVLAELVFGLGRSAQMLADPALGDWLERVTFNAAQGARMADGRAISYLTSDDRPDATAQRPDSYSLLNGRHGRFKLSPTHDDIACCCSPNSLRVMPHYVASLWLRRDDMPCLMAMAYGPSELRTDVGGTALRILQETQYPFEDEIRFTVAAGSPARLALWLRRPAWVRAWQLRGVTGTEQDGWILIDREWQDTTSFSLRFDVPVRVESYPDGEVAILRGALQFVQPIPHQARERPLPSRPGWPDADLVPARGTDVETLPVVDPSRTDLGFVTEQVVTGAPEQPWDASPVRLRHEAMTLVPIGCAPLRRAAFRRHSTPEPGTEAS